MALRGIDAITFGVADVQAARRFLDDWGLASVSATADELRYETRDGSEVIVRNEDDRSLPRAIEAGSTVREITWGAHNQYELERTLSHLRNTWPTRVDESGRTIAVEPNGLALSFRISRRRPVAVKTSPVNTPAHQQRIDCRGYKYTRAKPIKFGQMLLFCLDWQRTRRFYANQLGFILSDEYPGWGAFLRCAERAEHHSLFLINRHGRAGVGRVGFTVADIQEIIGAGKTLMERGWKSLNELGRHSTPSTYFWDFHNPLCASFGYLADEDYCTEAWSPKRLQLTTTDVREWAKFSGEDGCSRSRSMSASAAAGNDLSRAPGALRMSQRLQYHASDEE